MRKGKKRLAPVLLLGGSISLFLLSAVGSARAALTYYSENYAMEVTVSSIGVTLEENEKTVSYRNYLENDWSDSGSGQLLQHLTEEGAGKLEPGRQYPERLQVTNSGAIDSYVRVILYKSWQDEAGNKITTLSPDLIELEFTQDSGWVVDEKASTEERTVLYYTRPLLSGERAPALCQSLCVAPEIFRRIRQETRTTEEGEIIHFSRQYEGCWMNLEAEVDAVQTHNAEEAIRSAWGVDVEIEEDGTLGLR